MLNLQNRFQYRSYYLTDSKSRRHVDQKKDQKNYQKKEQKKDQKKEQKKDQKKNATLLVADFA